MHSFSRLSCTPGKSGDALRQAEALQCKEKDRGRLCCFAGSCAVDAAAQDSQEGEAMLPLCELSQGMPQGISAIWMQPRLQDSVETIH